MGETGIILTILGVLGVGAGVAYYASSKSTPAASGGANPTPASSALVCSVATTVNPHDHVRVSFTQAQWATIATAAGVTPDIAGLETFLTSAAAQQALGTTQISAWSPGNALPADWPTTDTAAATEYHVDFIYGGTTAFQASAFPITGAQIWTCKNPSTAANALDPAALSALSQLAPGNLVANGQLVPVTNILANPNP